GRDENEVHERFVLSITRQPGKDRDVYTLTDALHEGEGTTWVPLIDVLDPSWRTRRFEPRHVSASKGLMLPNSPSHIGSAPGTNPPSGAGPFAVTDVGFALFGDYQPSFAFTIADRGRYRHLRPRWRDRGARRHDQVGLREGRAADPERP